MFAPVATVVITPTLLVLVAVKSKARGQDYLKVDIRHLTLR